MVTIHKYHFEINDRVEIEMPIGSEILSIQIQNGKPTMWAKVNTNMQKAIRIFLIYGTGQAMNTLFYYKHIGSIQLNGLVWHIFE